MCTLSIPTDNTVGRVLTSVTRVHSQCFTKLKKQSLELLFFSKEEILKVANHSLEVLTTQMGFDTSV